VCLKIVSVYLWQTQNKDMMAMKPGVLCDGSVTTSYLQQEEEGRPILSFEPAIFIFLLHQHFFSPPSDGDATITDLENSTQQLTS
jgi:hypothetical protein